LTDPKATAQHRATYAFRLVLARKPLPAELDHVVELYRENLDRYRHDAASAKAMASTGLATITGPGHPDDAELAAWTVVANVLMNLDETVTKG
jgi:hypothetical protein